LNDPVKSLETLFSREKIFQRIWKTPEVREAIVSAFSQKAFRLREQGNTRAALAIYEKLIQMLGEEENQNLQKERIHALLGKANLLDDVNESIAIYDEVERHFDSNPDDHTRMIDILFSKADVLLRHGQIKATLAIYDEILARSERSPEKYPFALEQVMRMSRNSIILQKQGNLEATILFCDEIDRRLSTIERSLLVQQNFDKKNQYHIWRQLEKIRSQMGWILSRKARALARQGNLKAAIAVYDDLVARLGRFQEEKVHGASSIMVSMVETTHNLSAARALYDKAVIFGEQGDHKEEQALYDAVLLRIFAGGEARKHPFFGEELFVRIRLNQARILEEQQDFRGAVAIYDEIINGRLGDAPHLALLRKGMALERLGDPAAEAIYAEFGRYYGNAGQSVEERLARAVLLEETDPDAAIAIYEVIDRDHEGKVPEALLRKGMTLERQGKREAAHAAYAEIDRRCGGHGAEITRELLLRATVARIRTQADKADR
jgi:tetratricopeptide (TPR) repeat protein